MIPLTENVGLPDSRVLSVRDDYRPSHPILNLFLQSIKKFTFLRAESVLNSHGWQFSLWE